MAVKTPIPVIDSIDIISPKRYSATYTFRVSGAKPTDTEHPYEHSSWNYPVSLNNVPI
jgi:hypothetical protein